jgi:hypothetical protein
MISRKHTWVAGGALALALGGGIAAGCSNQLNDLGGVSQAKPDYVMTYLNVSDFPNVTLICIRGVGFATTTRDNNAAITRIPEWDAFCATKESPSGVPAAAPSSSATP